MSVKRKDGKYFLTRNSNHKHSVLDDLDDLKFKLINEGKCPAEVAKELEVPYNSVRYRIMKYFTPEEIELVCWKRERHTNNRAVQ